MHNFVDDNALSALGETVSKLIDTLESERNLIVNGLQKTNSLLTHFYMIATLPFNELIQINSRPLFMTERNSILKTLR